MKRKCTQCSEDRIEIIESRTYSVTVDVYDGSTIRESNHIPTGVELRCMRCGHAWAPCGIRKAEDLKHPRWDERKVVTLTESEKAAAERLSTEQHDELFELARQVALQFETEGRHEEAERELRRAIAFRKHGRESRDGKA